MQQRCNNNKSTAFKDYGGRGIKVCDRWLGPHGFENFFADMGEKPAPKYSLDRIDNDGPYSPENCRWATPREQAINRRNTQFLTYKTETKSVAQWAFEIGLSNTAIQSRLKMGWSVEEALFKDGYSKQLEFR